MREGTAVAWRFGISRILTHGHGHQVFIHIISHVLIK